jgi:hypothetical protein
MKKFKIFKIKANPNNKSPQKMKIENLKLDSRFQTFTSCQSAQSFNYIQHNIVNAGNGSPLRTSGSVIRSIDILTEKRLAPAAIQYNDNMSSNHLAQTQ